MSATTDNFHAKAVADRNKLIASIIGLAILTVIFVAIAYMGVSPFILLPLVVVICIPGVMHFARLAKRLEQSGFEEGMALVMEGVPMNCTVTDEKGAVLHCNQRAMDLFGATRREYAIKLFGDFLPEVQPDGTRSMDRAGKYIQAAFKDGTASFEWWHQMGPGKEQFPCEVHLAAADVDGMKRILVFNNDLRKAYAMRAKEEELRERMNSILDSSPILCTVFDENGTVVDVNREVENMFGVSNKQTFIDNVDRFFPKTQPDGQNSSTKSANELKRCLKEGNARYEWNYLHSDGSLVPTEEILQRITVGGKPHVIAYSRDLRDYYREREKERVVQEKIQNMMEQLNEHVEAQSASIAASSSATEEMIANIRSVTDTLSNNTKNVRELEEASQVGHTSLNAVVTDIQGIARESESLIEINAVMSNIASQTNLLSMNAAIEAAHAGESGRGFAVVADEIRKLAESSSKQSKTIRGVLKSIKESIDKITKSTDSVLGKFDAIGERVKTVAVQEENVLHAMEEQGHGSQQILQSVGHVKDVTHQVREAARRMVETSKEAMHRTDATEAQANLDDVTRTRNRKYFMETADQELRYCVEEKRDYNLIMFSVDNLRSLTDTHGAAVRDEILKILVMRARNTFKQGTLLARYSDEHFAISLPNVRHGTAVKLAEQVQKKIKDAPFATRGKTFDISISLGVATKTNVARSLHDILSNAEKALSNAQAGGSNRLASAGAA